jgi:hypothetical protein
VREIVIQDEIDRAFRRNRAALADIEEVFPDAVLPADFTPNRPRG